MAYMIDLFVHRLIILIEVKIRVVYSSVKRNLGVVVFLCHCGND
jgi:hypothetical protein